MASLRDASRAIREALGGQTAYLLYGADWFRKLGEPGDPEKYEVKQEGYWLLNRFMVGQANPCAFNVVDRQVRDMVAARPGVTRNHVAALIPMLEGNSEMLIVGGLRERLRQSHIALLELAAPIVAHLVAEQADAQRFERQKQQLNALGDIARVMTRAQEKERVLAEIATAVAGISGFDIVALSVLDPSGERLAYRVLNLQRFSDHPVSQSYRAGALDEGIIAVTKHGKPVLYPDLANDPRLPEQVRSLLSGRGLLSSMATFPLVFQGEMLGLMSLNSLSPHSLEPAEVELLEGLAAQVAMTLKGLTMYEELRSSQEKLQESAQRLQESMSIEYRLARTDPLTGIPNRRYLDEAIVGESARAQGGDSTLALVMADVDHFKEINDRFGHRFGDDILRLVASLGWQACRRREIVGRYGGDEFLFILPNESGDRALRFAEEFRQAIEKATLYAPPGRAVGVTVSVGVCECDLKRSSQPSRLVEMADKAMYRAKSQGGNQIVAYEPEPAPERAG
jgi:diguanylate cyclase (GGDEF)-like protein